jgi:peptidyl-prolyl cis-trans isomerase
MANPIVTIEMESGAVMSGELYPEIAPNTVNNFIALANSGFYDGVVFHRVIPSRAATRTATAQAAPATRSRVNFPPTASRTILSTRWAFSRWRAR